MGIFCWERRHVYERWPPSKRKGRSSVLREPASIIGKDSKRKSAKNSLESPTEFGYKCVCLNARTIVNKRNELNIMVEDIDPHIIDITESWATIYQMAN